MEGNKTECPTLCAGEAVAAATAKRGKA